MKAKVCVKGHGGGIVIREPLDFMFDAVTNRNRSHVADNVFKRLRGQDEDADDAMRTKVRFPRGQG